MIFEKNVTVMINLFLLYMQIMLYYTYTSNMQMLGLLKRLKCKYVFLSQMWSEHTLLAKGK